MGSVVTEILALKVSDCCRDLASQTPVYEDKTVSGEIAYQRSVVRNWP